MYLPAAPLPSSLKVAYGIGDFGAATMTGVRIAFLSSFLSSASLLSPSTVAIIVFVVGLTETIAAPIVGWLSDRTSSRWGRRRPWLLFGAPLLAALAVLMWWTPPLGETAQLFYSLFVGVLASIALLSVVVPYWALTPELTKDYDERVSLTSFRASFAVLGNASALALHPWLRSLLADDGPGSLIVAALWAVLCAATFLVVFLVVEEQPQQPLQTGRKALGSLRWQLGMAFACRPYRFVLALHLASWIALQLTLAALAYYLIYFIQRPELAPLIVLTLQAAAILFIFVWSALTRLLDKRRVYLLSGGLWTAALLALFVLAPTKTDWAIGLALLVVGAGHAAASLLPWAMLPDVIEFDERETGLRREGVFYGLTATLQRTITSLTLWLMSGMLALAGYSVSPELGAFAPQPESALFTVRLLAGPIPALLVACSLVVAHFYPVSRTAHRAMLTSLDQRRLSSWSGQIYTTTRSKP